MEIGFLIMVVVVVGGLTWWAASKQTTSKPKQKIIPYSEPEPQTPESSKVKVKVKGIDELIWQQEETNRNLKRLIDDFFWFRFCIAGVLIIWAFIKNPAFFTL